jgi:hypothetical protein
MKVGTINIDWFLKSKSTKKLIINSIIEQDFDFLIVTENTEDFTFSEDYFAYHSDRIPLDEPFEFLDYGVYLKGEQVIRTSIYSKYPSVAKNTVQDAFTSVCHTFLVDEQPITIYGTIVGTWGIRHQKDLAKKELLNFIKDSEAFSQYENFIVAGDLNTSFIVSENREMAQINSRAVLELQTERCKSTIITANIPQNIDHIFISDNLKCDEVTTFILEEELKDKYHKGIAAVISI